MRDMSPFLRLMLCVATLLLSACNSHLLRDPEYAASYPAVDDSPQLAQAASGAIYQRGYEMTLFADLKAHRVGDILTVRLAESNTAKKKADTNVTRDQSSTIDNPTILGASPQFALPGVLPLSSTQGNTLETSLGSNHQFEGAADSSLSNSLNGDITVTVADVLPNGNLLVRGEKRLNINQGNEYIKLSGIVRPIDIAADNSVSSTKVADASIVYNGDGATAESNRMGWLSRFFASALFPF